MAQYVVHKKGIFFNDDCYQLWKEQGNIITITRSLEEAREIKLRADLEAMKIQGNQNAVLFFSENPNYKEIYKKLSEYYEAEFGMYVSQIGITLLPNKINDKQAAQLLSIMEFSFYIIVEYGDDEVIDPTAFELKDPDFDWF